MVARRPSRHDDKIEDLEAVAVADPLMAVELEVAAAAAVIVLQAPHDEDKDAGSALPLPDPASHGRAPHHSSGQYMETTKTPDPAVKLWSRGGRKGGPTGSTPCDHRRGRTDRTTESTARQASPLRQLGTHLHVPPLKPGHARCQPATQSPLNHTNGVPLRTLIFFF
uniref:Uncharacterized protein n=1 Tax=Arundo donax TaxID=35708 RepID=A0A0A8XQU3_ARUDO